MFSILEKQKEMTLKKINKKLRKKIIFIKLEDLHLDPYNILSIIEKN